MRAATNNCKAFVAHQAGRSVFPRIAFRSGQTARRNTISPRGVSVMADMFAKLKSTFLNEVCGHVIYRDFISENSKFL